MVLVDGTEYRYREYNTTGRGKDSPSPGTCVSESVAWHAPLQQADEDNIQGPQQICKVQLGVRASKCTAVGARTNTHAHAHTRSDNVLMQCADDPVTPQAAQTTQAQRQLGETQGVLACRRVFVHQRKSGTHAICPNHTLG